MYKTSPHKGGLARLFYTKTSLNASTRTSSSSWFLDCQPQELAVISRELGGTDPLPDNGTDLTAVL